jgi:hypothetical protein
MVSYVNCLYSHLDLEQFRALSFGFLKLVYHLSKKRWFDNLPYLNVSSHPKPKIILYDFLLPSIQREPVQRYCGRSFTLPYNRICTSRNRGDPVKLDTKWKVTKMRSTGGLKNLGSRRAPIAEAASMI